VSLDENLARVKAVPTGLNSACSLGFLMELSKVAPSEMKKELGLVEKLETI